MRSGSRRIATAVIGIALAAVTAVGAAGGPQTPAGGAAQAGQDLNVTVTYKGKGTVSKTNEISVFLFDTPDIGGQSIPIGTQTLVTNGGTVSFTGVTAPTVYLAVVYDEKGVFEPGQGPPPTGTPVAIHGGGGGTPATGVKPGKDAKVAVTFDDSVRMP